MQEGPGMAEPCGAVIPLISQGRSSGGGWVGGSRGCMVGTV